jgi:hypothetical protein
MVTDFLTASLPLAIATGNKKARSKLIISPVLLLVSLLLVSLPSQP